MAFLGVAGIGTIIAGQLVTVVAGQGIGSRAGRELGEALSLGRWRGVEANPHHAGGGGGRGILFGQPTCDDGWRARVDLPSPRNPPGGSNEGGVMASTATSTCAEDPTSSSTGSSRHSSSGNDAPTC